MAHINVGPTKAVGVGPTARREREVEAMHQAIRSGQISTKYPNGAVVTIFDPPPPDFDPLTADPTQLWRHGFPPRPSDPAALRQWGALLGTPLRFVTPTITRRPALRRRLPEFYGHESTDIWSGAVVFASTPATLFTVTGQWKVPHIKPFSNGDDRYVGVWVGIDGDRSGDVLQAGIAAEMSSGDDQPDLWAWFEWFPDDSNELDVPVAVGDSMSCVVTADQDCLPRSAVQHGQWKTIDDDHTLVPMHDGKILDWVPDDGTWRLWHYDPTKANILTAEVSHGQWSSVGDGHVLVPMHDGKILDWVPDSGHWRLWRYDPTKANILAGEVSHGQWSSVGDGHVLVPMIDGNVIDWVPDDGTWRLWKYDPTNTQDCLPANAVSAGRWTSLDDDHTLVPMHDGRVLDWTGDGTWRLWNYDPTNKQDCLPANAVAVGQWITIDDDHTLLPMHDGRVLDWTGDGTWRLWNYDAEGRSMVSGTIVLRNETQHWQFHTRLQAPDNTLLVGNCAEWIIERPTTSTPFSDSVPQLADYGTVQFTHAHAERTGGAIMKPSDGDTITMKDNAKTLSTATATGETVTCKFV
jgi:hypothetical protein